MIQLLVAGFAILSTTAARERRFQDRGTLLHATVADAVTGIFLLDAEVTIRQLGLTRVTDFLGDARLPGIPSGAYTVEASRRGYETLTTVAKFSGRDSIELVLLLAPRSQELPTVTIKEDAPSPFLKEFDERRRQGRGYYITDSELRAWHGRQFEDVIISKIPGLRTATIGTKKVLYSTRGPQSLHHAGPCVIAMYVNGVHVEADPQLVPLEFIGGIEYYNTGYVPVQYQAPGNDCGVILLWSRP
jgi:hypothetical protein